MSDTNTSTGAAVHEVLAAVLSVRCSRLNVLLWQRARTPHKGRWALPGGVLGGREDVEASVVRQLAEKVDVREVAHREQLAVFSDPRRHPDQRRVGTAFLGLVPADADPHLPPDTSWCATDALPPVAFDHGAIVAGAVERLRAKLSYTNIGFALAPPEFTIATLRVLYAAALGYDVDPTNLQRFLARRGQLEPTGGSVRSGPSGGRPASLYRFRSRRLQVTDEFVAFRPPR